MREDGSGARSRLYDGAPSMRAVLPRIQLATDRLPSGPWIFARQVRPPEVGTEDGSLVEVFDASERFVGQGLYNSASDIRVRLLSRGRRSELERPRAFLQRRLAAANRLRTKVLRLPLATDAYRVAHAEGDDLSGLVVDKLGPALVVEYHALGFWRLREELAWVLGELYPGLPVVHRVPPSAARAEGFEPPDAGGASGTDPDGAGDEVVLVEHGLEFCVVPGAGHKTGWFCDQRDNRQRVAALAAGRRVLDLCCNAGAFGLFAARAGARSVHAVDLDEKVLERAVRSARRNRLAVEFRHADAFDVLRELRAGGAEGRPELVVVDPHKLVRGRAQLEQGLRRYSDLNALALEVAAPGALVATFSCSGALDLPRFLGMLFQAARRAERGVRLLEILGAAPDHPQRPDFPGSRYLKGALLALD